MGNQSSDTLDFFGVLGFGDGNDYRSSLKDIQQLSISIFSDEENLAIGSDTVQTTVCTVVMIRCDRWWSDTLMLWGYYVDEREYIQ